jgi:hypothetical protein
LFSLNLANNLLLKSINFRIISYYLILKKIVKESYLLEITKSLLALFNKVFSYLKALIKALSPMIGL